MDKATETAKPVRKFVFNDRHAQITKINAKYKEVHPMNVATQFAPSINREKQHNSTSSQRLGMSGTGRFMIASQPSQNRKQVRAK